jgi:mannitol 2-dehydrogenase
VDEHGQPIDVVDRLADTLIPIARSQRANPRAFLENSSLFGNLAEEPRFVEPYLWTLDSLHRHGARSTLDALLHEDDP